MAWNHHPFQYVYVYTASTYTRGSISPSAHPGMPLTREPPRSHLRAAPAAGAARQPGATAAGRAGRGEEGTKRGAGDGVGRVLAPRDLIIALPRRERGRTLGKVNTFGRDRTFGECLLLRLAFFDPSTLSPLPARLSQPRAEIQIAGASFFPQKSFGNWDAPSARYRSMFYSRRRLTTSLL